MKRLDDNFRRMLQLSGVKLTEEQIEQYENLKEEKAKTVFYIEVELNGSEGKCEDFFGKLLDAFKAASVDVEKDNKEGCSIVSIEQVDMDEEDKDEGEDEAVVLDTDEKDSKEEDEGKDEDKEDSEEPKE